VKTFSRTLPYLSGLAAMLLAHTGRAATPAITNLNLSGETPGYAASVPVIAIDPANYRRIAVAWRLIDPLGGSNATTPSNWQCHLSLSSDGGRTFQDQPLHWGITQFTRCNAPFVAFSPTGTLYAGATLTGAMPGHASPSVQTSRNPPAALPAGFHPSGADGIARSDDFGKTWSETATPIASDMLDRFDVGPEIPLTAKQVPWDGARGVVDPQTGAIYVTGSFPARPGSPQFSQRFFALSRDGGKSFGRIKSFAVANWPDRWDGDIAAAHGTLAITYVAAVTPDKSAICPCAVFGFSQDGATFQRHLIAPANAFDLDTLVHYPEVAADPARKGQFAVALIGPGRNGLSAMLTEDAGSHWRRLSAVLPPDVTTVSRPAVSFSPQGLLVLAWRGYHADGGYDIYAAAARRTGMGPAVRVSTETSHLPKALERTYALRGDFHTTLAVDSNAAQFAWSDARSGTALEVYCARVPLAAFSRKPVS
jgi:hypothetical protein